MRSSTVKEAQNRIINAINKHDLISFDIFDTLLVRPYNNPGDLFVHLEKIHQMNGFAAARCNAEWQARKKTKREEITYDEIYDRIDAPFECMYEREIELEKLTLRANPDMQKYFQYAVEQKKKVIIISDMYLPKYVIEDVLISNNYYGYDKIYLSSDCFFTKHTGNLFLFALNDMGIHGQDVLHIGDNYYSDLLMAKKNGIHACHYTKIKNQLFHDMKNAKRYRVKNAKSLGASIILGTLALWNIKHPRPAGIDTGRPDYFEDFGYVYGGPVVLAYMEWLKNKLKNDGITDVLFVARDGYILKEVFDLMTGNSFNTLYIYAPRIVSMLFLMDCDNDDFFESIGLSGIKKILCFYKNKDPLLRSATPPLDGLSFCAAKEFFQKNIALYKQLAQAEKDVYYKYAVSGMLGKKNCRCKKNCGSKKIAVIDSITAKCSAQKLLQELSARDEIGVQGYYWSVLRMGGGG
ncbi:MAG: HAD-IA family hydrolase [Spirochaetaceae bacterium]|jgi:HAD superfamily hydrolase (TIGR01549 family)|nr:HAD-IA family hydrolase [Spirochaetaceae bacterium]